MRLWWAEVNLFDLLASSIDLRVLKGKAKIKEIETLVLAICSGLKLIEKSFSVLTFTPNMHLLQFMDFCKNTHTHDMESKTWFRAQKSFISFY